MRRSKREAEFTEFFAARRLHFRRIAYALCGDWDRADDLVQHAFTKLYVSWPRIRRDGAEEAYVRRIIVTGNIDESRRAWRRRELVGLHDVDRPAKPGLAAEDRDSLVTALLGLPVMQRRTVVLRHWLGLSVEET
ncbi:MAG: sigma factor, partial [Nocardioides sp.]